MKSIKYKAIWIFMILSGLVMLTFAEDIVKTIQAVESNAQIIYNGNEVTLEAKPFSIDGYNYLPVKALAVLFDKNIDWDQKEQKVIISDKADPKLESLKSELSVKDNSIAELQNKVKKLESDLAGNKKLTLTEFQHKINSEHGGYNGIAYNVILSGNEDEIRVKVEVDLSEDKSLWNHLSSKQREEMIKEICAFIYENYNSAIIKGYVKDIASSRSLVIFHNTADGTLKIGSYRNYSTISSLEDTLNDEYDDFFRVVKFTIVLRGNENKVECVAYLHKESFEGKWDKITDSAVKNFAKKLCSEVEKEFRDCNITGSVYDTDSGSELASWEQQSDGDFSFSRN